jgi:hypothetical protein
LVPASLYCLYMSMLHHRNQPTMISGPWDFVGVLAALSGFLLIGGSTLIFSIHTIVRDYWLLGGTLEELRSVFAKAGALTFGIWGAYFLALVGGSVGLLRSRRRVTVVYQIAPLELEELLAAALDRLKLPSSHIGARWFLGSAEKAKTPEISAAHAVGVIEIDGSSAMRYVTLRWQRGSDRLRQDVEAEIGRDLAALVLPSGPAATWFMTVAGALFTIMIFLLGTFLIVSFRRG